MKYFLYQFFIVKFFRMPDVFFHILFQVVYPVYKVLHTQRAYGRVQQHLIRTGIKNVSAKDVFKGIYYAGIDSYRLLLQIPKVTNKVIFRNEDVIKEALAKGPVAAISIHQGSFELLHRSLCRYSKNVHVITNPLKNKKLTLLLNKFRAHPHLYQYTPTQLPSLIKNFLKKQDGVLAMLFDQAQNPTGVKVNLFNIPSTLYLQIPLRVNQMGAGIVTFHTFREKEQIVVQFETYYPPKGNPQKMADSIATEVECWIKKHPDQWTWNYHKNFTA